MLLFEAATFVVACLVHAGVLVTGYEHDPRTTPEVVYPLAIVVVLVSGLAIAQRASQSGALAR